MSGFAGGINTADGDLIVHGASTVFTNVNFSTGQCLRYTSSSWEQQLPPALEQQRTCELVEKSNRLELEQPIINLLLDLKISSVCTKPTKKMFAALAKYDAKYKPPRGVTKRVECIRCLLFVFML